MNGAGALEQEGASPRPLPVMSRKSFISRTLVISKEQTLLSEASATKRKPNPQSPSLSKSDSHPSLGSDSDACSSRSSTPGSVRSNPSQSPRSPYAPRWKDSLRGVTPDSGTQPNVSARSPRFASMTPKNLPSPRAKRSAPQSPSGTITPGSAKKYYESPKSVNVNSPSKGSRTPRGRQTPPRKERSSPQLQGSPRKKKASQPASPGSRNPGVPSTEISFSDLRSDNDESGGLEAEPSFSSADGEAMGKARDLRSDSDGVTSSGETGGLVLWHGAQTVRGAESKQGNIGEGVKSAPTVRGRRKEPEDPTSSDSSLDLRTGFRQGGKAVLRNHPHADVTLGAGGSPSSRLRLLHVTGDGVTVVDQDSGQLSPDKVQKTAKDLVGASFGRGGLGPGFKGWSGPPRSEGDIPVGWIAPGGQTPKKETLRKSKSAPRFDPLQEAPSSSTEYAACVRLDVDDISASAGQAGMGGTCINGPDSDGAPGVVLGARPRKAWGAFHSSLSPGRFGQLARGPDSWTSGNGEAETRASENGIGAQVFDKTEADALGGASEGRYEGDPDVSGSSGDYNLKAAWERIKDIHTAQSSDSERDSLGRVYPLQEVGAGRGGKSGADGRGVERDAGRWEDKTGKNKKQHDVWEGACKRQELQGLRLKEILDYKAQMKEKFVRLLLGDDLSGGSRGASPALAISNAVTNLAGAVFGDVYTLEPLDIDKKPLWTREIDWLISPAYQIVEMRPGWVVTPAGKRTEIMQRQPRGDLQASLPVLKKLDALLIDTMDTLINQEFSYKSAPRTVTSSDVLDAYWRPKAVVPTGGLSPEALRKLRGQKEVVTNIYAVAMAINAQTLAEMAIPDEYWESLPRTSKAALGEELYRALTEDGSEIGGLISALGVADEQSAGRVASAIEAAIHLWQRKIVKRNQEDQSNEPGLQSWRQRVETMTGHGPEARERWVARASELLHTLFATFPGLPHTRLAQSKIQHNKDVGQAILESYSRVLETVASNLLAGISHVLDSHEEAYSLGKALRASTDYSLNQDSPTSLLTNPAPTPPKTPGDSDRSSGLTGSELEGEDASGGVANAPAGNPLQQWVVLEGRSAQSAQNPGKGMDVLRTAVGRLAGPSREYQVGT